MTLDDIIRKAADKPFAEADVAAFCAEHAMTPAEFADAISRSVATRYHGGELDFGICDGVMNHLYAFTTLRGELPMPPFAYSVFLAFDDGEYSHPKDSPDSDPEELYTKPAIMKILATDEKST